MARQQISERLKRFIREQIQTVFRLEVLLLLHRCQYRSFTAAEVANELGIENELAQEQLAALGVTGLVVQSNVGKSKYSYHPADDERGGSASGELFKAAGSHLELDPGRTLRPPPRLRRIRLTPQRYAISQATKKHKEHKRIFLSLCFMCLCGLKWTPGKSLTNLSSKQGVYAMAKALAVVLVFFNHWTSPAHLAFHID